MTGVVRGMTSSGKWFERSGESFIGRRFGTVIPYVLMAAADVAGNEQAVILSEAKDHLERIERRKMILRFAQDDRLRGVSHGSRG